VSARGALRIVVMPEHLRQTGTIALTVGTIIALINHGDVVLRAGATAATWTKIGVTYLIPFVVSNLGLLAGKRTESARGQLDKGCWDR
jgi:hypothetical protein